MPATQTKGTTNEEDEHVPNGIVQPKEERSTAADPASQSALARIQRAEALGFVPRELLDHGVTMLRFGAQSTLDNEPLYLLQYHNWKNLSADLYQRLLPALRLASIFFRHPSAGAAYFQNLALGARSRFVYADAEIAESRAADMDRKWIHSPAQWSASKADKLDRIPHEFADHVDFEFTALPHDEFSGQCGFPDEGNGLRRSIEINTVLLDQLRILPELGQDPTLRLHYMIAVIVTHEVAHALERHVGKSEIEAYYGDHNWTEAGWMWEKTVLGGGPFSICKLSDMLMGLGIHTITGFKDDGSPKVEPETYGIPMSHVYDVQQKETWVSRDARRNLCKIPRTGPTNHQRSSSAESGAESGTESDADGEAEEKVETEA